MPGKKKKVRKNINKDGLRGQLRLLKATTFEMEKEIRNLSESNKFFRVLEEHATDMFWLVDSDFKLVYISPSVARLRGFTAAEVMAQSYTESVSPASLEIVLEQIGKARDLDLSDRDSVKNKVLVIELELTHKNGSTVWMENHISLLWDDSRDCFRGFFGVSRDITPQKEMDEKLKSAAGEWRKTFDAIPDLVMIVDQEHRIIRLNQAVAQALHQDFKEILGKNCCQVILGVDTPPEFFPIEKTWVEKREQTLEISIEKFGKDFLVSTTPIFKTDGEIDHVVVVMRDITERKRMELVLKESEDKHRAMFELSRDAIMLLDRGGFLDCNQATLNIFGCSSREQFIFRHPSEVSPPIQPDGKDSLTAARERIKAAFATGEQSFEWLHQRIDGTVFPAEVLLSRIEIGGKQVLQAIVRDITERKQAHEELQKSEGKYRQLVELAQEGIWAIDQNANTTFANPRMAEILGYTVEEMLGKPLFSFVDERGKEIAKKGIERRRQGIREQRNLELIRKDGSRVCTSMGTSTILDDAGNYAGALAVVADITARRVSEEALQRSEERLRLISDNASDFISLINQEGTMLYANPSHRLLGYDLKEVLGKSVLDFVNAEDKEKIKSLLQLWARAKREDLIQMAKEGKSGRYVYRVDDKFGNIHYLESNTNIVENNETGELNILFISRDITGRKKMEEALLRSEERFRLISENSSDLITLINMSGKYVYASPSHRRLGLEPGDLIGKSAFANIHPEDVQKVMEIGEKFMSASKEELARIAKEGANERINFRFIDGWGQIRHLQSTGDVFEDAETQEFNILLVGRDVTETKKMEEELLKNEKLQSLSMLAGGIAHDFNNLLAAIMGNISVALSTTDSKSEMHELLKDVETASRRASGLVQQLLTFARGGTPIKKKMAIGQLLKDDVQMALSGSRVECEYFLAGDLWPVEVDPIQFRQAVSALVNNAVQAIQEGGKIVVRAKNVRVGKEFGDNLSEGEYVKISFRDSGKGIPPESLPKIFDPFFTTRPESSGLGLSTVYSIIKRHNGHIAVDSTPGRGTTFSFYLPARRENGQEDSKPRLEKTDGAKRILVMDDELIVQKVTGRMLKQIGYEVEFAKDGQEAIEIYQKARETSQPFAAVIMDLTIPGGMGGQITVQKLIEIDPQVKVIVSSGYSNDPIMSDHRKYGFCGVIAKPYRFEEMTEVIKNVIENE